MTEADKEILHVDALVAGYGRKQVVNGVSLDVDVGEIVAVIGHNGAGKSTILKAVFGLIPTMSGRIVFPGCDDSSQSVRARLLNGIVYVPQGHRVFEDLTVAEHLALPRLVMPDRSRLQPRAHDVLEWFPILKPLLRRRGATLSGGERQAVALAVALTYRPRLLLLDEPSLGLAPSLVHETMERLSQVSRECGCAILVVEQKVREVLHLAARVYVIRRGCVTFSGSAQFLRENPTALASAFL